MLDKHFRWSAKLKKICIFYKIINYTKTFKLNFLFLTKIFTVNFCLAQVSEWSLRLHSKWYSICFAAFFSQYFSFYTACKVSNMEYFLVRIFLYSVRNRKIRTRKNSVFGHFSRSVRIAWILSFPRYLIIYISIHFKGNWHWKKSGGCKACGRAEKSRARYPRYL